MSRLIDAALATMCSTAAPECSTSLMQIGVAIAGVIIATLIFRRAAREKITHEDTADAQMWARSLGYYQHRNDETATRQGVTASESRIGHTGPTKNNTSASQV